MQCNTKCNVLLIMVVVVGRIQITFSGCNCDGDACKSRIFTSENLRNTKTIRFKIKEKRLQNIRNTLGIQIAVSSCNSRTVMVMLVDLRITLQLKNLLNTYNAQMVKEHEKCILQNQRNTVYREKRNTLLRRECRSRSAFVWQLWF